MAKVKIPSIVCDVCEKEVQQTKAKGAWLHIPSHFVFGMKAPKRPVATDLCSARCAKKWIAGHRAFTPEPEKAPEPSLSEVAAKVGADIEVVEAPEVASKSGKTRKRSSRKKAPVLPVFKKEDESVENVEETVVES